MDEPHEELHGGPDRAPIRLPRWARTTVACAAVLALGVVALDQDDTHPLAAPGHSTAVTTTVAVGATGPHEKACIHTDNRTWLNLSFVLANTGNVAVTVRNVRATLPLEGLRPSGARLAGGTCSRRVHKPPHDRLAVGSSLLVTLRFRVSATCPQPIPVEATLAVRTDDGRLSTHVVPVLQDLSEVPFMQCRHVNRVAQDQPGWALGGSMTS